MPENLGDLYRYLKRILEKVSTVPDLESRRIIERRSDFTWSDIAAYPEKTIKQAQIDAIQSDLSERLRGKPLSKIYGVAEFYGREFITSEDVLDPRPESELIVDIAVDNYKTYPPERILDLGTGTGCLILSLLHVFPAAQGMAVDKSDRALSIARQNAEKHNLESRVRFIESDWWEGINVDERFDMIVSNPPYIQSKVIPDLLPEVREYDPILALDGGEDGLQAYKEIFSRLFSHLKPGGKALFEIGYDQGDEVARLGKESGFTVNQVHRDLAGLARVVEITNGDK
ncbi:MAG: peptide chain release factor N(5)-glutamine methyltransferase [Alphaproteobacteria bacterium]